MTVPTPVLVCPIAQGWDPEFASDSKFNYRIKVAQYNAGVPNDDNHWHIEGLITVMSGLLKPHDADGLSWKLRLPKTSTTEAYNPLHIYCWDLQWLMLLKLSHNEEPWSLRLIYRIEERIRA